jgi:hypothetical protein
VYRLEKSVPVAAGIAIFFSKYDILSVVKLSLFSNLRDILL